MKTTKWTRNELGFWHKGTLSLLRAKGQWHLYDGLTLVESVPTLKAGKVAGDAIFRRAEVVTEMASGLRALLVEADCNGEPVRGGVAADAAGEWQGVERTVAFHQVVEQGGGVVIDDALLSEVVQKATGLCGETVPEDQVRMARAFQSLVPFERFQFRGDLLERHITTLRKEFDELSVKFGHEGKGEAA